MEESEEKNGRTYVNVNITGNNFTPVIPARSSKRKNNGGNNDNSGQYNQPQWTNNTASTAPSGNNGGFYDIEEDGDDLPF